MPGRFISRNANWKGRHSGVIAAGGFPWGSSPYAPTIKINKIPSVSLTSCGSSRRSENRGQSNLSFTGPAARGRAKISAQETGFC
jgi:hypothetical protein